jgi:hypothetical protein
MGYHYSISEGNHVLKWCNGTKHRKKLAFPCRLYSWRKFLGGVIFVIAWTLMGSIVMPCWETMNPRRRPTVRQNAHLRGFKKIL